MRIIADPGYAIDVRSVNCCVLIKRHASPNDCPERQAPHGRIIGDEFEKHPNDQPNPLTSGKIQRALDEGFRNPNELCRLDAIETCMVDVLSTRAPVSPGTTCSPPMKPPETL